MAFVYNIKYPKGITTETDIKKFFLDRGANVEISQAHKVPSGKTNTTVDGDPIECQKAWGIIKNLEKEEIIARFKAKQEKK